MSVIGYLRTCQRCDERMLVTAEARHTRMCPDCLTANISDAIERAHDDDGGDWPIGEVCG